MINNAAIAVYSKIKTGYDLIYCPNNGDLIYLGKYILNNLNDYKSAFNFIKNGDINISVIGNNIKINHTNNKEILHYKNINILLDDYRESNIGNLYILRKNNIWMYTNKNNVNKLDMLSNFIN